MPTVNPSSAVKAFRSPPARRSTMRRGQPKNTRAPIITSAPSTKRTAGDEPALALNSFAATLITKAPSTRPMISGRTYCTGAALCSPHAPAISRRKQAMQKPMLAGFPKNVSSTAASPTAAPANTTNQFTFFMNSNSSFLLNFSASLHRCSGIGAPAALPECRITHTRILYALGLAFGAFCLPC